tara:strand:+ start:509 stop:685 length:177 start_codon:yes stop_codon:yes gene_type:complete
MEIQSIKVNGFNFDIKHGEIVLATTKQEFNKKYLILMLQTIEEVENMLKPKETEGGKK